MYVNIKDIPGEGLQLCFKEDKDILNKALEQEKEDVRLAEHVDCYLSIEKDRGEIYIKGYMDTRLNLLCSLCLTRFERNVHWDIFRILTAEARGIEEKEKELVQEELDITFFDGEAIDTRDILREQLFLELPMRFQCREDCKGLCPRCGQNLNDGNCTCSTEKEIDPRLARLKELKIG